MRIPSLPNMTVSALSFFSIIFLLFPLGSHAHFKSPPPPSSHAHFKHPPPPSKGGHHPKGGHHRKDPHPSTGYGLFTIDFPPYFREHANGHIERLQGLQFLPACLDYKTHVTSKDVTIPPTSSMGVGVPVRLYLPKQQNLSKKRPILVYCHGGAFLAETPYSPTYHNYLNSLVSEANVVAVSVDYRRAPEHPLPAAYEDSWAVLQWVASHAQGGGGNEAWLRDYGDCSRIIVAGDSAGANIAHNLSMRAGREELGYGSKLDGAILVHPYFWGEQANMGLVDASSRNMVERMWKLACPSSTAGLDDPFINPMAVGAPSLKGMGCKRVLVCAADKDFMYQRAKLYYKTLGSCGWQGSAEMFESTGERHLFHLYEPNCQKAVAMRRRVTDFICQ